MDSLATGIRLYLWRDKLLSCHLSIKGVVIVHVHGKGRNLEARIGIAGTEGCRVE